MKILLTTFLMLTTGLCASIDAEQPEGLSQEIVALMASYGFENIRASILNDNLMVEYENRVYYREKDAINTVVSGIMEAAPEIQFLTLIAKKQNIPIFQVTISRNDFLKAIEERGITGGLSFSQEPVERSQLPSGVGHNSSTGKIDIEIYPEIEYMFGNIDDSFKLDFAISPGISTFLGHGINAYIQARFLLYEELGEDSQMATLGRLYLDYIYKRGNSSCLKMGGGYFGNRRYGLSSELYHFGWGDKLGFSGTAALLGTSYYSDSKFYITKLWRWTALANVHLRVPRWNLILTTRAGRFLHQDWGVSAEVTQFFSNTSLSGFAAKTDAGSIFGFRVQFLTYPRRHMKPGRLRVRIPPVIELNYRYETNDVGKTFFPRREVDYITKRFWLIDTD